MKRSLSRIVALVFVVMFLFSSVSALADYARVVNAKMPVYSDPELSNKLGTAPKWMIAIVKATNSGVAKLNVNGKICYAKTSYLATANDVSHVSVYPSGWTVRKCKIYCYPSTKSKYVTVRKGVRIECIEGTKNWYLCRSMSGRYMGYIQAKDYYSPLF